MKQTAKPEQMTLPEIRKAIELLEWAFDSENINHPRKLVELCAEEERRHRGCGPDFAKYHPGAASVKDCARLFAVKRLAEYLNGEEFPSGKEYLHLLKSCFLAAGMVDEYRDRIFTAWAGKVDLNRAAALDYVHFVKISEPRKAA